MILRSLVPGLALAVLAGAGLPARADRTFINRSEYTICLVPDPDRLPSAGIRVTPGPGCLALEDGDLAEAATGRELARTGGPQSPIALERLAPAWSRTVLYLEPGGSVTFAAAGEEAKAPLAAGFRVGIPVRAGLDGIQVRTGRMVLVFELEATAGGPARERLDGRWDPPATGRAAASEPHAFRRVGDEVPVLELVDRPEPAACAIL